MAAATTTALAGAAGSAEAKRPERDAEFDAIENRMLDLGKRGTSLSTNQKYFVLLAVATAVAAEGGVRDIADRALRDKVPGTLITFASIAALGGCEPQLKAHIAANLSVGATKQNLTDALRVADPLLGFPRTLNALGLVRAAK